MNHPARAALLVFLVTAQASCAHSATGGGRLTAAPDRDRLVVRRLDVVDENGVVRMSLASPAPGPITGGVEGKRAFPYSGLLIFDREGNERGGFGVGDIEGGAIVAAQDHVNGDAIGWRIMPDGSVAFLVNQRAPVVRDPARGGVRPASSTNRIQLSVAPDGAPAIALADAQERPRVRLTVTAEGYGAIEFLDAQGKVVEVIAPEARAAAPAK